MSDTKTAAQLLAEAATYNDKVDVLVALAQATVDDETATKVADHVAHQKAVGESTDDAALDEAIRDTEARLESLTELREARDEAQADSEVGENVSASGSDVSDVEGVDEDSPVGPVDAAEAEDNPSDREDFVPWSGSETSVAKDEA